jgi:hypothetical protein
LAPAWARRLAGLRENSRFSDGIAAKSYAKLCLFWFTSWILNNSVEYPLFNSMSVYRQAYLETEISNLLKPFALPADWAEYTLKQVNEEKRSSAQSAAQLAAQKRGEIAKVDQRLQKLLDAFVDNLIDRETYTVEKAKLLSQRKSLREQMAAHAAGRSDWLEAFEK